MTHAAVVLALFLRAHLRHPLRLAIFLLGLAAPSLLLLGGATLFDALRQQPSLAPADEFVVLQSGAGTESRSLLATATVDGAIAQLQAGARIGRDAMSSQIALDVMVAAPAAGAQDDAHALTSATLRGLPFDASRDSSGLALSAGRWPRPGARELVASAATARWLQARAAAGTPAGEVVLGRQRWQVVGVATDVASPDAWALYAPLGSLQSAFGLDGLVSMLALRLDPAPAAVDAARRALGRLHADALELVQRRAQLEQATGELGRGLAWPWRCALAVVVVCALLAQAMLTAVIAIEREPAQACLHALGVGRRAIDIAALLEGALLGTVAAALAVAAGWLAFVHHPMKVALSSADFELALRPNVASVSLTLACGALLGAAAFGLRRAMFARQGAL